MPKILQVISSFFSIVGKILSSISNVWPFWGENYTYANMGTTLATIIFVLFNIFSHCLWELLVYFLSWWRWTMCLQQEVFQSGQKYGCQIMVVQISGWSGSDNATVRLQRRRPCIDAQIDKPGLESCCFSSIHAEKVITLYCNPFPPLKHHHYEQCKLFLIKFIQKASKLMNSLRKLGNSFMEMVNIV